MRFSLVHPSRQRLKRAEEAILEWHGKASGDHAIEHLLSVDEDDPELEGYRALAARHGLQLICGANRSLVEAVNRAAKWSTGDVIIVVSDDFGCPQDWDRLLADVVGARRDTAVLVADGRGIPILTLPIIGRLLYERIGFIYHPGYFGLFADDDLTKLTEQLGVLVESPHLLFPHRHYSLGLADVDATYLRHNSLRKWWAGWRLFEKRSATRFGLDQPSWRARVRQLQVDAYYLARIVGSDLRLAWRRWLPQGWHQREERARHAMLRVVSRVTGKSA